jgi:hypothetical protein
MECALCPALESVLFVGGQWFCQDCCWKFELLSGAEEEAWIGAEYERRANAASG